ncbi:MAG: hypothetical protein LBF04_02395 [Prevotellaceae bacterium]|jgi:hypothetical protein|nr:hypothetical protein [Prevotellaceae bacterium]
MKKIVLITAILAFAANTFAAVAGIAGSGRINNTTSSYEITYFITDHLGSTRVAVSQSGAAFSARKTQQQIRALNNALFDEKGNLKNWSQFKQDAAGIVKNYNQTWLRSEYDIAVRRARLASIWRDAEDNELYTNMRWTPSLTSPENRRPEHIPFYNRVFRRDDAVWASGPGTLWGCKCGIEPTDDEPDGQSGKLPKAKPDPGIDNNPGESGEIFTDTHPYYKGLTKKEIAAAKQLEDAAEMERLRAVKKELVNEMKPLYEKTVELTVENGTAITVEFIREGNKHVVDDVVISRAKGALTLDELKKIDELLKNSAYQTSAPATGKKLRKGYKMFYYFKDTEKELYYNVAEIVIKKGEIEKIHRFLYSITTSLK